MTDEQLGALLAAIEDVKSTIMLWSSDPPSTESLESSIRDLTEAVQELTKALRAKK